MSEPHGRPAATGSDTKELDVAVHAARTTGSIIRAADFRTVDIQAKGSADLVTSVDREAEVAIREILVTAFPGSGFLAEESAPERLDARMRWIVDPLDGTLNFVSGQPVVAVSIALERDGLTRHRRENEELIDGWESARQHVKWPRLQSRHQPMYTVLLVLKNSVAT